MQTNVDRLVRMVVTGEIDHPTLRKTGYVVDSDGKVAVYPSVGGISLNARIGMPAVGLMADHVEPGVSLINKGARSGEYSPNAALNVLACIGNPVQVLSGEAKGETGFVTGKHGGVDHVMVDFEPAVLRKLTIGDKMQVEAFGVGLEFKDYPHIKSMSLDPGLADKIILEKNGDLVVGVTHCIPGGLMGSGLGQTSAHSGDYDIQVFDQKAVAEYKLDALRFGDIVAIMDSDASYGWIFREGAVTIGIIAHSDSVISGHGPGVTTILTSRNGSIKPNINPDANLINFLYES